MTNKKNSCIVTIAYKGTLSLLSSMSLEHPTILCRVSLILYQGNEMIQDEDLMQGSWLVPIMSKFSSLLFKGIQALMAEGNSARREPPMDFCLTLSCSHECYGFKCNQLLIIPQETRLTTPMSAERITPKSTVWSHSISTRFSDFSSSLSRLPSLSTH